MEFINKIKDFFYNLRDRIAVMDRYDYFPLNKKFSTFEIKNVAKLIGIYLGAILVALLFFIMLGTIPFVGILFRIIGVVCGVYSLFGIFAVMYDVSQNF